MRSQITNFLNSFQHIAVMDTETTTHLKGSPFSPKNKLCLVAIGNLRQTINTYTEAEYQLAKESLEKADLWIGFNIKFDLHWIFREFGILPKAVWDCQYAEFLFSNQTWKYPSLNESCIKRGLPEKLDVVKTEFWEKGIDTPDIPENILREYAAQDIDSTYHLFQAQVKLFEEEHASKFKLFRLHCNDLLVLREMEWNGILYDAGRSLQQADGVDAQVKLVESKLQAFTEAPVNFDSRDQVSKFLYGGELVEEYRVPIGVYKTGAKTGLPRYKVMEKVYTLPRLVEPLKGSEMAKEGIYSTEESTLLSLKANRTVKKIVGWILERAKLQKLNSTYLRGLVKTLQENDWLDNILHSSLNQCVAQTGRLSSTKPNQQNLPKEAKKFCISRY